jgi:signal transduction histidine kinase
MTRRLLLSYVITAAIVLLVLEIPLAIFFQQRETASLTVDVQRDATVLASLYEDTLERRAAPDRATAVSYAARTGARVVVVDKSGRSLVDTSGAGGRDFSTRPEISRALRGDYATGTRRSNTLDTGLLFVAVPIASGGEVLGAVRLTLDQTHGVQGLVHRYWLALIGIAAVVLAAVAAIGWAIARSVDRPLRRLEIKAARFATGDLSVTGSDTRAPPEIAALGATMDTMARRLRQLLAEHRAFVADASHQLRTPLTALRLRLENLQIAAGADDVADLGAAIDETDRLTGLVNDLLRLAHAEPAAEPEPVDLVRLAGDRVDTWSAMAGAAAVSLDLVSTRGPVVVSAVPTGVEQIMDNLLDNAIAVSPPGARVRVTVAAGRARHGFTIADEGPGLSDDQKMRATDRFWRLDDSRPGSGLGLPIAKALAEASGGSLVLHDGSPRGLAVTVELPAVRAQSPPRSSTTRTRFRGGTAGRRAAGAPPT